MSLAAVHLLTESGKGIGFGHLTRMNVVASELERRGIPCRRWCQHVGEAENPLLAGWEIVAWREEGSPAGGSGKPEAAVIDSYIAGPEHYRELGRSFFPVMALDDFERLDYPVDMVLNPNPHFRWSGEAKHRGGSAFVLIRDAFRERRRPVQLREELHNIVVTVGGDDPLGLLPQLLELLAEWSGKIVVLAGNAAGCEELAKAFARPDRVIEAALPAERVRDHFLSADLAISACGQTLHELAFLGIPAIGIRTGEDQRVNQDVYLARGFLGRKIVGTDAGWSGDSLAEWKEMQALDYRRARVAAAAGLIDGRGGERLVDLLLVTAERRSTEAVLEN